MPLFLILQTLRGIRALASPHVFLVPPFFISIPEPRLPDARRNIFSLELNMPTALRRLTSWVVPVEIILPLFCYSDIIRRIIFPERKTRFSCLSTESFQLITVQLFSEFSSKPARSHFQLLSDFRVSAFRTCSTNSVGQLTCFKSTCICLPVYSHSIHMIPWPSTKRHSYRNLWNFPRSPSLPSHYKWPCFLLLQRVQLLGALFDSNCKLRRIISLVLPIFITLECKLVIYGTHVSPVLENGN